MRILILNCDMDKSKRTNGTAVISRLLRKRYRNLKIDVYNSFENKAPSSKELKLYDHAVITGSRASVYEDEKWIRNMKKFITEIDRMKIPTLGICFGFQIVAEAFGGKVVQGDQFIEGFKGIKITGRNTPLFNGIKANDKFYESHKDILKKKPKGAKTIAKQETRTEAYILRNFYCLQFHPEILPEVATVMAERDGKKTNRILGGVSRDYDAPAKIIYNFMDSKSE